MLMKLQDSIDEIENRKKSEVVNLKRNNELALKLLELETELQSVLVEKLEKVNSYDRINAELECVTLSLECCKEEKEKLEASFRECEGGKSRFAVELDSIKELEKFRSYSIVQKEENNEAAEVDYVLNESCRNSSPDFFCAMCSTRLEDGGRGRWKWRAVKRSGEREREDGRGREREGEGNGRWLWIRDADSEEGEGRRGEEREGEEEEAAGGGGG
ncbi:unnamed protein product [Fraxinus pennsylvanica]|uniref:Uncharacterized protein n=1 Tax=Fraxinus pennsylvanica TaxID=56036 RepID=A0AAD2DM52_9LAMI|nr:unnamed protein product [Fraxinus pennsylvanica]